MKLAPAGTSRQGCFLPQVTNMKSLSSTVTPHRLYTFRCNGMARWMAVPYPPEFPSAEAEAQMLRTLLQTIEAESEGTGGTVMNLTHLGFVDQMAGDSKKVAGPEFASCAGA